MGEFLVGCDVGTGGTKAAVMASDGAVLGAHFVEYPLITTKTVEDRFPGAKAEQEPEWYWRAAADTIRASIHQSQVDPREIKGVGISGLSPTCILVDKELRSLQNAHIWMDRRATTECAWLRREIGEERIFRMSGNLIDPFYGTPKLMWIKYNRPHLYQQTYKFLSAVGYLAMKLTGKTVMDYSNASLFGIVFDIVNRKWNEELIEAIGLDQAKFPLPFPCDEVIGEVTKEAAERTGLRRDRRSCGHAGLYRGMAGIRGRLRGSVVIDHGDLGLVGCGPRHSYIHSRHDYRDPRGRVPAKVRHGWGAGVCRGSASLLARQLCAP